MRLSLAPRRSLPDAAQPPSIKRPPATHGAGFPGPKRAEIPTSRESPAALPALPRSAFRLFAVILTAAALAFLVTQLVAAAPVAPSL